MNIVIVGAGIGGLAAARAAARAGHEATIIERAPASTAIGAGLTLWPNAVMALDAIGVGDAVREIGARVTDLQVNSTAGHRLSTMDAAELERTTGAPSLLVERPRLHEVLSDGLNVRSGQSVTGVSDQGIKLEGGEELRADLVIGADGVGSVVREFVAPGTRATSTGRTVVRAMVDLDVGLGTSVEVWGTGMLAGLNGLPHGRTYWYLEAAAEQIDGSDPLALVREREWPAPFAELAAHTDPQNVLVHDVVTLKRLKKWTRLNVGLLGDAAHAMTPNLGQGAAQAIEDAAALGTALAGNDNSTDALAAYEQSRVRRAAMVQRESGRMAMLALSTKPTLRNTILRLTPAAVRHRVAVRLVG